jgi:ubiquinone/menaquinone biosynthesis C-methylase UbiE
MNGWLVLLAVLPVIGSVLFYTLSTGVPPVPSTRREIAVVVELLRQAELPPGATIYELGSGWGSLALGLAEAFPEARVVGLELSWLPLWVSRLRARGRVEFRRQDFLSVPLPDADAIATYLGIAAVRRLAPALDRVLRPGTPVVSLCFCFRDRRALQKRPVPGLAGEAALYSWPALEEPR